MDFQLSEEQQLIYDTASKIAENEFGESAFTWETEFPEENLATLEEQGLLGIGLPIEYGGGGYSVVEVLLVRRA